MMKESTWIKASALLGATLSVIIMLFAIRFTPDYVAMNISSDGILDSSTLLKISIFRSILKISGIFIFLTSGLFLIKPHFFNLKVRKMCLNVFSSNLILLAFALITLTYGFPTTIKAIVLFRDKIEHHDAHALRLEFHKWYRRQHKIWEFTQSDIPFEYPFLVNATNCPTGFIAYHLAPRPVYTYTSDFASKLDDIGQKYYVLTMTWNDQKKILEWSIKEKPSNKIIIHLSKDDQ